jgi:hypothetical protein
MSDPGEANKANPHPVSGHRTPEEIAKDEAGTIGNAPLALNLKPVQDESSVSKPKHSEHTMGGKPSNNFQSDRPESGGADRSEERENSGLLEREKQKFAAEQANKARTSKERASTEATSGQPASKPDVNPASRKSRGQ